MDLVPAGDLKSGVADSALFDTHGHCEPARPPASRRHHRGARSDPGPFRARGSQRRLGIRRGQVRVRLIEIGEAVKADLLDRQPEIPCARIAGMRDPLAHSYFDTSHAILTTTVDQDLSELNAPSRMTLEVDED